MGCYFNSCRIMLIVKPAISCPLNTCLKWFNFLNILFLVCHPELPSTFRIYCFPQGVLIFRSGILSVSIPFLQMVWSLLSVLVPTQRMKWKEIVSLLMGSRTFTACCKAVKWSLAQRVRKLESVAWAIAKFHSAIYVSCSRTFPYRGNCLVWE